MIRITCKQHNFRRCRVAHPKGTTEYPDDTFTPEQLKVLQAEPKLTVEIVEEKEPGNGGTGEPVKEEQGERPDDAEVGEQAGGVTMDGESLERAVEQKPKRKAKK